MRILLSGYTGFLGQHLLKALYDNHEIIGLGRKKAENTFLTRSYTWDELHLLPQTDWCIHLSGLAHDEAGKERENSYMDANFELTRKLANALRNKCKYFMYFSSIKAVCESGGRQIREDMEPEPHTAYGRSKLLAERFLNDHAMELGMHVYIMRPVMIYGQSAKGNLRYLLRLVESGLPYPFTRVKNEKSLLYIGNLLHIVKHFIHNHVPPGTYHLADPDCISTFQLVQILARVRNRKLRTIPEPGFLYAPFTRNPLQRSVYGRNINKLLGDLSVDTGKLKLILQNDPLPYSTESGIKHWLQ